MKSESTADMNAEDTTDNLQASRGVVREMIMEMQSAGKSIIVVSILVTCVQFPFFETQIS